MKLIELLGSISNEAQQELIAEAQQSLTEADEMMNQWSAIRSARAGHLMMIQGTIEHAKREAGVIPLEQARFDKNAAEQQTADEPAHAVPEATEEPQASEEAPAEETAPADEAQTPA